MENGVHVFVDKRPVDDAFLTQATTVEQTLRHVQIEMCPSNHLVVGFRCDGSEIPADRMAATLQESVQTYDRIDVSTGTKSSLVFDAMQQAASCLDETDQACTRVASLLTEGQTADAAIALGECLRVWQQIHEAVAKSIALLEIDPERVTVRDDSLMDLIGRPKDVLLQIKGALEGRDYVLLADILQYEFGTVRESWHSMVAMLQQHAEQMTDTPDR